MTRPGQPSRKLLLQPQAAGMIGLVDILISTIGIFLLFIILQNPSEEPVLPPVSFTAIIDCASGNGTTEDGSIVSVQSTPKGQFTNVPTNGLDRHLESLAPKGGRFLVLLRTECFSPTGQAKVLYTLEERMNNIAAGLAIHEFEIAPLTDTAQRNALVARWASGGVK